MTLQRKNRLYRRGAFSLIELLLVISILAIIATLGASVLNSAEQDALESRTRAGIERISQVLNRKLEENTYRILPVRLPVGSSPQNNRDFRQQVVAEFARVEFPFRIEHLTSAFPQNQGSGGNVSLVGGQLTNNDRPQVAGRYAASLGIGTAAQASVTHESAELLHSVLALNFDEFGEPLSAVLRDREIGDTDGDGYNEILDAFGDPLLFSILVRFDQAELDELTAQGAATIVRDPLADTIGYESILDQDAALLPGQVRGPWPIEKHRLTIRSVNLSGTTSTAPTSQ